MSITTAQALMKAEQLEVDGVISKTALALIQLKNDIRTLLGNDAYEQLIESESNNIGILLKAK